MHHQNMAILRSLIAVAWADGKVAEEETEVIEALLQAFGATPAESAFIRDYAKTPRLMDSIDPTELDPDDRRALMQHAVLLTFIDGKQDDSEKDFLEKLAAHLSIEKEEKDSLMQAATDRAKKFLDLLLRRD